MVTYFLRKFLERKEPEGKEYSVQKMILGTHTSDGEQNSLLVVEVYLPLEDTEVDCRQYDDERGEIGSFGGTEAKVNAVASLTLTFQSFVVSWDFHVAS